MSHNPVTVCGKNPTTGVSEAIEAVSGSLGLMDFRLLHALQVIKDVCGDDCYYKPKTLFKFGQTVNTAAGRAKTTVAEFQGGAASTVFNETYATGNTIDFLVSDNASDTEVVRVEGHTLSGSNLTFVVQNVTLNGQTPQSETITFDPPIIIPKNSDVRLVVYGSAADLDCTAGFNAYFATIRGN